MSYQVLARKYRPQTFEEVIGQKPIVVTLQNAVSQNRLHHAYLFSGLRGVGKTTVARLMAKAVNCAQGPTPKPCNNCSSCDEIATSRSLDVLEIDGASNRGIDAIRELRETVRYAPARDRYKVFIIDEVHMLTAEAWNALLKTLEEPPAHVLFLFATTEYRKIPLTILSRCQHFEFKKISPSEIRAHLVRIAKGEGVKFEEGTLDLLGRLAEGSLRDAQSALDQVIAFSGDTLSVEQARTILGVIDRELVTRFFTAVRSRNCDQLIGLIETVFDKGYQPVQYLEDLMAYGRDLLLACVVPDPTKHLTGTVEEIRALTEIGKTFGEDALLRLLELMTREEPRLKSSAHPRFLLEAMAIKLSRLQDLRPIEDLIARLEKAPGGPGHQAPDPPSSPTPPEGSPRGRRETTPAGMRPSGVAPADPPAAKPGTPEPAPVTRPSRSTTGGEAVVEAILKKVHDERGALGGFLGQAAWVEIRDDALCIAFGEKQAFFKEKVASRDAIEYLKRAAEEIAGRELSIRVETATPALIDTAEVSPAEAEASRKRRLREDAMKEPAVQKVLEAFGGEIVDVDSV
ncbi:MAG: DNA polymerase III subunit gamma/tau [Acidobacteria bacterium]|nr:DNA polymerase III subunit gamma/tau [Acidobacteriota bacterium]